MVRTDKGIWVSLEALLGAAVRGIWVSGYLGIDRAVRREASHGDLIHTVGRPPRQVRAGSACAPRGDGDELGANCGRRRLHHERRACPRRGRVFFPAGFWRFFSFLGVREPPRGLKLLTLRGEKRAQCCAAFLPRRQTGYLGIFLGLFPAGREGYLSIFEPPKPRTNDTLPSCIPESWEQELQSQLQSHPHA